MHAVLAHRDAGGLLADRLEQNGLSIAHDEEHHARNFSSGDILRHEIDNRPQSCCVEAARARRSLRRNSLGRAPSGEQRNGE
jgi:hypothetical protein